MSDRQFCINSYIITLLQFVDVESGKESGKRALLLNFKSNKKPEEDPLIRTNPEKDQGES